MSVFNYSSLLPGGIQRMTASLTTSISCGCLGQFVPGTTCSYSTGGAGPFTPLTLFPGVATFTGPVSALQPCVVTVSPGSDRFTSATSTVKGLDCTAEWSVGISGIFTYDHQGPFDPGPGVFIADGYECLASAVCNFPVKDKLVLSDSALGISCDLNYGQFLSATPPFPACVPPPNTDPKGSCVFFWLGSTTFHYGGCGGKDCTGDFGSPGGCPEQDVTIYYVFDGTTLGAFFVLGPAGCPPLSQCPGVTGASLGVLNGGVTVTVCPESGGFMATADFDGSYGSAGLNLYRQGGACDAGDPHSTILITE